MTGTSFPFTFNAHYIYF